MLSIHSTYAKEKDATFGRGRKNNYFEMQVF